MRKRALIFPIVTAGILLSCRSEYEIQKDADATQRASSGATATALSATIVYLESHPLVSTITPTPRDCVATMDYFGVEICVERESISLFGGTPTAGEGKLTTVPDPGKNWLWYYDQSGNRIGQLAGNLSFDYKLDSATGEYIIQIEGWIAINDLILDSDTAGRTTCSVHTWNHLEDQRLCHTHIWDTSGEVLGSIPSNFEVEVVGGVTTRQVINANGIEISVEGREVILSQAFRLKSENVDT